MPGIWDRGIDFEPLVSAYSGPCAWHESQMVANVSALDCVVGDYNQISTGDQLQSFFTHLEVTLFRTDRHSWSELQQAIRERLKHGYITVLRGWPEKTRWLMVICNSCGAFCYAGYSGAGKTASLRHVDHDTRVSLYRFFKLPVRPIESHLRRVV